MKKLALLVALLATSFLAANAKNYTPLCMKREILLRDTYIGSASFSSNGGESLIISVYEYPIGSPESPGSYQYWTGVVSVGNIGYPWIYDGGIVAGPATVSLNDVTVYYFTGSNSGVFSLGTQSKQISL